MKTPYAKQPAFTIVELLIVIVVIGILATISIIAYTGIQQSARKAKINADLTQLEKAIIVARNNTGKTFGEITGVYYTLAACMSLAAGTDVASLPDTHSCKSRYQLTLTRISDASGINVKSLLDPYGRPYLIDENEGEGGNCNRDVVAMFTYPFNGIANTNSRQISLSGNSGCAV
jgi:prepilin-type N-terminal cleavage/methylation domain-containing protein